MNISRSSVRLLIVALLFLLTGPSRTRAAEPATPSAPKIRVLLVHGGHEFETNQFFQMFQGFSEMTVRAVENPGAQDWFSNEHAADYDVLVFYDLWQNISETAKRDLVTRLQDGKGLVALHHCLASFQSWDEFKRIIGGRYTARLQFFGKV